MITRQGAPTILPLMDPTTANLILHDALLIGTHYFQFNCDIVWP